MWDVPLKAWKRALVCTLAALVPLGTLSWGVTVSAGAGRVLCVLALLAVTLAGALVAWIFLPDVDWPGASVVRGSRKSKAIAITFDDGPNGVHTAGILDTLARHGAKATFFCVGKAVCEHPSLVRRMAAEGHEVGNHTWSHRLLPRAPRAVISRELVETQAAIVAAGAPWPSLFRAPKGFKSWHLPALLSRSGLRLVAWTHGVWDTDRPGADVIVRRAKKALGPGKILLLHDGLCGLDRSQTAAALEEILLEAKRRGLACVTVPELLRADQA